MPNPGRPRCDFVERDRYGRFVGDCYRADGESVSRWLVSSGHALDWPRYSNGAYASEQDLARAGRRGMWQGDFLEAVDGADCSVKSKNILGAVR